MFHLLCVYGNDFSCKLVLLYEGIVLRVLALCFANSKLTLPFRLFQFSFKIFIRHSVFFLKLLLFLQSAEGNTWILYVNGFWPSERTVQQIMRGKQHFTCKMEITTKLSFYHSACTLSYLQTLVVYINSKKDLGLFFLFGKKKNPNKKTLLVSWNNECFIIESLFFLVEWPCFLQILTWRKIMYQSARPVLNGR